MKSFINLRKWNLFFLSIYLITTGCQKFEVGNSFLAAPPELSYSIDSVFVNSARAKELLWNAYSTLPYGLGFFVDIKGAPAAVKGGLGGNTYKTPLWSMTDLTRDMMTFGPITQWEKGTISALNVNGNGKYDWTYSLGWKGIRDCYIFIANVDKVPDMSADEKVQLKAEAKIIIATHYVEMFRHYGGILYLDHAYTPTEDMSKERLTVMQTVDTITSIIDEAIPLLPFELDNSVEWSGRITQAAAMGLKVKFLNFAASPLFNSDQPFMQGEAATMELVWTGGYKQELWVKLKDACKVLIDKMENSSYQMVNTGNPQADYQKAYYNRTLETIYSTRVPYKFASGSQIDLTRNNHWMAVSTPLHNYAMKFPMKNGKSIENPESGYDPKNPYYNRDPRLYESVTLNGSDWQGRKAEMYEGGRERKQMSIMYSFAGYFQRKWKLDMQKWNGQIAQWPYVRIPEVYFAYAEALNELNNGPTDDAFKYVNRVRARVGVGPIEDFVGKPRNQITKQEFLEALLNERVLELGCENVRWYDMVRYKMENVFTEKDLVMEIKLKVPTAGFNSKNVTFDQHDKYFDYVIKEKADQFKWQSYFDPKYYLEPFPFSEVQKGYGLIQNPGWEL